MNRSLFLASLLFLVLFWNCSSEDVEEIPQEETPVVIDDSLYFPPLNSNSWETTTLENLGWNADQLAPLLSYLEQKNSKSFI